MKPTIRVLIATTSHQEAGEMASMLAADSEIDVLDTAGTVESVITRARELSPDVVLLDVDLPEPGGIRAIELVTTEAPTATCLAFGPDGDRERLRSAMRAGARDYLPRPLQPQDVIASVRATLELDTQRRARLAALALDQPAAPPALGKVICLFSPKGGVGRTTVATNLAIAIRMRTGRRVALVDCNLPFGDIGIVLNLPSAKTMTDLVPNLSDLSPEVLDSVMAVHESGVRVLLAPARPELADLFQPDHVRQILEALRAHHDYVIVDTWTSFHDVILAIFDVSSEIVLLTTLDMPAVKNIRLFLDVCHALQFPKERIKLVLNRADSTGGLRVEDIEQSIQHKVAANLVSAGKLVTASINRGVPFLMSDPQATISRNIQALAEMLLDPAHHAPLQAASAGNASGAKRRRGLW